MNFDRNRAEAQVLLEDRPVGTLRYRGRRTEFNYTDISPIHPILGQAFEADPLKPRKSRGGVPSWFENLLPEPGSGLRMLLEADMGEERVHDFRLLVHVGEDLPGSVRVVGTAGIADSEPYPEDLQPPAMDHAAESGRVKFSFAGVQRKMSMLRKGKSLILPAHGKGGNSLVKFQDGEHSELPENEFIMLRWAAAAGIRTASGELVDGAQLEGLPAGVWDPGKRVLALERFDRRGDGRRIHQEDLAQVWEISPRDKYLDREPYLETRLHSSVLIGKLIDQLCPSEDVAEYIRRLAMGVVMGNTDMHLKNWSLVYPDGRSARLSPAYDLVCVTAYPAFTGRLAFPISGEWDPEKVNADHFRRLGESLNQDPEMAAQLAIETAELLRESWSEIQREHYVPDFIDRHISDRLTRLAIYAE